jgi:hypothetical protein
VLVVVMVSSWRRYCSTAWRMFALSIGFSLSRLVLQGHV